MIREKEASYACEDAKICNTKECYHRLTHAHTSGCNGLCYSYGGHPRCLLIKGFKKEVTKNAH